jgi:trimethylamine-N-oxide reductase (cytochrome c)
MGDDEGSTVNDIREHRVLKDGRYYLVARMSRPDAEARGVKDDDLVRI